MSESHSFHDLPPLKPYVITFIALVGLTLLNVALAQVTFGAWGLTLTMILATINGILMLGIFMGLWWDKRFNTLTIVATFLFLALFFLFTMADVATRGALDPREGPAFDIKSPVHLVPEKSEGVH